MSTTDPLVALLTALAGTEPAEPQGDGTVRRGPRTFTAADSGTLTALRDAGERAAGVLAALHRAEQLHREQQAAADLAAAEAAWAGWTPATIGLVETPAGSGRWCWPDRDGVWVTADADPAPLGPSYAPRPVATRLRVHADAADGPVELGEVIAPVLGAPQLDPAREKWLHRDGETRPDDRTYRDLTGRRPWDACREQTPPPADLAGQLAWLADAAPVVLPWLAQVAAACADAAVREQAKAALARDWERKSRSKRRIPNKVLTDWCKKHSRVDYDASGYPTGGWQATPVTLVGEERPAVLSPDRWAGRRRSRGERPAGVERLFYVVRLEFQDAAGRFGKRERLRYHSFSAADIDELRGLLPGCVVKAPEDRKVVFVAFDAPEFVTELDAALAEWVLAGPDDE